MLNQVEIQKSEPEHRMVWGVVYAPMSQDADGEHMDAETIRKMAYNFMRAQKNDKIDLQHNNKLVDGARVVESFIARKGDPDFPEGAWVAGVHVPDDATWQKIKRNEINGFSVEAFVQKQTVEVEVDLPAVMRGKTYKSEDHEHEFYVGYDKSGNFIGGTTNLINGHSHVIKRGTLTEAASGHSHRFSHLEGFNLTEV